MSKWLDLDAEIIELTSEEEFEAEIAEVDGYKENIFRALTRITMVLSQPTKLSSMAPLTVDASIASLASNKVKLPKLSLPRFGGNLYSNGPHFGQFFSTSNSPDREVEIKYYCSSYELETTLCAIVLLLP